MIKKSPQLNAKAMIINQKTQDVTLLPSGEGLGQGLMAHLVLGYPSLPESLHTVEKYIAAGIQILELQIPFSHPTADGPVITRACQEAVRQGVSVQACIDAIRTLRTRYPEQEIMVMSYLNRVFAYGIGKFLENMNDLNIKHLIIPDLPVDSPLATQFSQQSPDRSLRLVPVLAANVPDPRLEKLLHPDFDFFYLMSDFKITGAGFSLHPSLKGIIRKIKTAKPQARVGIGFGISTTEQVRLVLEEADIAIIGSALIQAQSQGNLGAFLTSLTNVSST